jgi:hypothetical protein
MSTVEDTEGLVGYWRLDRADLREPDVALDATGRHHGKIHGNPTWVAGRVGDALLFDGNDHISLGSPPGLDINGDITLAAWVKIDAATDFHNIVCRGHAHSPRGDIFLRLSTRGYVAGSWDGNGHETAYPIAPGDIGGGWVHLAGTHDGQFWRLFRNGEPLSYKFDSVGALPVEAEWAIGARGKPFKEDPKGKGLSTAFRYFRGAIDEVRIYNRALDGREIRELFMEAP